MIAWTDGVIACTSGHDPALVDVALTPPGDLSALRSALQPICDAHESSDVAAALFDRVARDLASGRRGVAETYALLRQARQMLALPAVHADAIKELGIENYLAVSTPDGDVTGVGVRLAAWLDQFAGAEERLLGARANLR